MILAISDILSFIANPRVGGNRRHNTIRRFWYRAGGVLALTLLAAGCDPTTPNGGAAPANMGCDLNHQRCTADTRWGRLGVELSPHPMPVLDPISIDVRFDRANETRITAQLDGVGMDMGPNLATLQRIDGQTLRGRLIIPICLTGTMKWRLRLLISDGTQEQTTDFSFEAPLRPGHALAGQPR